MAQKNNMKIKIALLIVTGIVIIWGTYRKLTANNYVGRGRGYSGIIELKVKIKGSEIKDIKVIKQEDRSYMAKKTVNKIINQILEKRKIDVEDVAGATATSMGLKEAVKNATAKAGLKFEVIDFQKAQEKKNVWKNFVDDLKKTETVVMQKSNNTTVSHKKRILKPKETSKIPEKEEMKTKIIQEAGQRGVVSKNEELNDVKKSQEKENITVGLKEPEEIISDDIKIYPVLKLEEIKGGTVQETELEQKIESNDRKGMKEEITPSIEIFDKEKIPKENIGQNLEKKVSERVEIDLIPEEYSGYPQEQLENVIVQKVEKRSEEDPLEDLRTVEKALD